MSAHRYHPRMDEWKDTILFDDCPGCARHSKELGLSLDEGNWQEMWDRMLAVEILDTRDVYASNNEAELGTQMYRMYVALERYTAIDPQILFAPWKLV